MIALKLGSFRERVGDVVLVKVEQGNVSLSTPICSAQDGPRMTGKPAFGGKKAPPFGSKDRKIGVKKAIAKKIAAKKATATTNLSVAGHRIDIDLGKDGAEWKHGYIPENAAAAALKDHKAVGTHPSQLSPSAKRYLSKDERKSMSSKALKEHAAAHEGAAQRARTPSSAQLHSTEAKAAKRELARRVAAKAKAKAGPPSPYGKNEVGATNTPLFDAEIKGPFAHLTFDDITAKIKDPKTPKEDKIALKAEVARRTAEAHELARQGEAAIAAATKELGDGDMSDPATAGRVFAAIYRVAPKLKPHLEKLRNSRGGVAVKKAINLEAIISRAMEGAIVPLVGAVMTATILH